MSTYTTRYLLVVRADLAAAANAAAKHSSFDLPGGQHTFTVGLSATGAAPASAYWCSVGLTPELATAIRDRLKAAGATDAEVTPVPSGQTPASTRFAVFDAADWTPEQVLVAVGMKRITTAP